MLQASNRYKEEMRRGVRGRSHILTTVGVVNQTAQKSAVIGDETEFTYFSDQIKPLKHYAADSLYSTCEENFSSVDGSMYFLPRREEDAVFYNGAVPQEFLEPVTFRFAVKALSIKGLTIDFGEYYPERFDIGYDGGSVSYENRGRLFRTDRVFENVSFITVAPAKMAGGMGRMRIISFLCGTGHQFTNDDTLSFQLNEYVSGISDTLPSIDGSLTIHNYDMAYDVDNEESSLHFLEIGQEMTVSFGYELEGGGIEWMEGGKFYLKSWEADETKAVFNGTDRFDAMNDTYYLGTYREEGYDLYGEAVAVLEDAGVDGREYYVDPYLKRVRVKNPLPPVSHAQALQLIANAGRCILKQGRNGNISILSSFIPEMTPSCNGEQSFSHVAKIAAGGEKDHYAMAARNFSKADGTQYFLTRGTEFLNTGYVSRQQSDAEGRFEENPVVVIDMESRFKAFDVAFSFSSVWPEEFVIRTYYDGKLLEELTVSATGLRTVYSHEFLEFDRMEAEFVKNAPDAHIYLDRVEFLNIADYRLRRFDMTSRPKGVRGEKLKNMKVCRYLYMPGKEEKELLQDEITAVSGQVYRLALSEPAERCRVVCAGGEAEIVGSSSYCVDVRFDRDGPVQYSLLGYPFEVGEQTSVRAYVSTGEDRECANPLVSGEELAKDLLKWLGDYYAAGVEYEVQHRGDPILEANDLLYLEKKNGGETLVRSCQNTLKFDGALRGAVKARRFLYVEGA